MTNAFGKAAIVVAVLPGAVLAQTTKFNVVEPAELLRVEDGVFALDLNQTIDITDRHLLMALVQEERKCLAIKVGGRRECIEIGQRFNFKNNAFALGAVFKDRQDCFLDVVKIEDAKGVDPRVTFRLYCV